MALCFLLADVSEHSLSGRATAGGSLSNMQFMNLLRGRAMEGVGAGAMHDRGGLRG